uniref:Uncharacterized protein n=1 Tax=Apteryx owenii TaxID=8824 RepID=A0A8B9PGJ7_APTOW
LHQSKKTKLLLGATWICYICTLNHHALDQCLVIWKILDIGCTFTVAAFTLWSVQGDLHHEWWQLLMQPPHLNGQGFPTGERKIIICHKNQ